MRKLNLHRVLLLNSDYVESNNKIPMSIHNANYTKGYTDTKQAFATFGHVGSLPEHTNDNYKAFYLGIHQRVRTETITIHWMNNNVQPTSTYR